MKVNTLNSIRTRPRFQLYTDLSKEEYAEVLKKYLENSDGFSGNINSEAAIISVKTEIDNYWKPNLALRTEIDDDTNKIVIRGIFGPSSAVWTFFMFLYFIFGILWMVFITLFYVERQIKSNDFPWALNASFVALFLIFCTYAAARFGQFKSRDEMEKLRDFARQTSMQVETEEL